MCGKLPRLQRFCCCCSLRKGTLVIASLGLLCSILSIFYPHLFYGYTSNSTNAIIARIIACILYLLIHGLLIAGVHKKQERLMLPWIILVLIESVLMFIYFVIMFIPLFAVHTDEELHMYIALVSFFAVYDALCWYSLLCVWSHYKELRDSHDSGFPKEHYSTKNDSPPEYSKNGDPPA